MRYEIKRPTELVDELAYILAYAPNDYPQEDFLSADQQPTNATVFGQAFEAMERFIDSAKTVEGRERLRECDRNLHVAYELYESGDVVRASEMAQETEDMFWRCRKYISISDE